MIGAFCRWSIGGVRGVHVRLCLALALVGLCLLAACSTSGRRFDSSALSRMEPGRTTFAQAVELLGAPDNIYRQRDGAALALWQHSATVLTDAIYFRQSLLLSFDSGQRFVRVVDSNNVLASPARVAAEPTGEGGAATPAGGPRASLQALEIDIAQPAVAYPLAP